ncbi:MAG: hypothetical protein DMG76_06145 [Acidobacteria bacterium]|nr:MAG: hypothetical protein DMG76_06145 [Acidobacteriota bacterium]
MVRRLVLEYFRRRTVYRHHNDQREATSTHCGKKQRAQPLSYLDSGAVFSRHPTIEDGVVVGGGAKILGNIIVGKNCRIGAGSVVLRNVPDDSTVFGVPGHIIFRQGKRVVITDPKQINDPYPKRSASVATEVHKLRERVKKLEGLEEKGEPPSEPLQRIMDDLDYQI